MPRTKEYKAFKIISGKAGNTMAQPKKDYIPLHIKMDASLMRRLNKYCDEVGQTKTMAVERIIAAFLDAKGKKDRP